MDEESGDDIPNAKGTLHPPSQQASHSQPPHPLRPSSAPSLIRIVRLLCTINLQAVSATFPYVEAHASSIITVGFSLRSTWGRMTSNPSNIHVADASSSAADNASTAAATAHHHHYPSVYRLGLCYRPSRSR